MRSSAPAKRPDSLRRRDDGAFERLLEPHRAELQAHCYRMLGSAADAEDAVQETLLRAWRGLPRFEGRSSLRSWLYRIATNVSLKMIERRPKRVLPIDFGAVRDPHDTPDAPLAEAPWLAPYPDETLPAEDGFAAPEASYEQRESVELAFVAALQHLPSRQRAVLLLRDVLGFAPAEIARTLDTTPNAIYSTLKRARRAVKERLPPRSQQLTLRSIGDRQLHDLVARYVQAWEQGDVATITAMLTDDVTFSMPPRPSWYRGREAIATFLTTYPLAAQRRWHRVPIRANGQLAFAVYGVDAAGRTHAHAIEVLTVGTDAHITGITSFLTPEAFARFGVPDTLAPTSRSASSRLLSSLSRSPQRPGA
jgi:RNA polymerase sigma-70 factor, ECF subfamily